MPNLFLIAPGIWSAGNMPTNPYWKVLQGLGYIEGKNARIWSTTEDITDNVELGGFSRCSKVLLSEVQEWMGQVPPPHVLMCGSRGARLVSRLMAEGHQMPPVFAMNGMFYYQFLPHDSFDSFEFWSPEFGRGGPRMEIDRIMQENALKPSPVSRDVAPRVVVTSGAYDTLGRMKNRSGQPMRFAPFYIFRGLASCLHDLHFYYHEADGHSPDSLLAPATMSILLQLAAYGKKADGASPKAGDCDLGLSDEELSSISAALQAGQLLCQSEKEQSA